MALTSTLESPGGLVTTQSVGPPPELLSQWGLRLCISNRFPARWSGAALILKVWKRRKRVLAFPISRPSLPYHLKKKTTKPCSSVAHVIQFYCPPPPSSLSWTTSSALAPQWRLHLHTSHHHIVVCGKYDKFSSVPSSPVILFPSILCPPFTLISLLWIFL